MISTSLHYMFVILIDLRMLMSTFFGSKAKGIKKAFSDTSAIAAFDFNTKKISAYGIDNDIIEEICKFSFPLQCLLVEEAYAVIERIEKEYSYEIYEGRKTIIEFVQTKKRKEAEDQRLSVVKLTERIHDKYWNVKELGNVKNTESFISMLEASINPIISKFDQEK
ncbi:hypothetical protein C1645_827431 [Glomus cerebriforme]|uniref:Uncharacterized protein n=1 Tax=Glomus cerebriforme TaxID=658196 RepID=A0A397SNX5_9GLOM|nr:hypothetical protein C1645_827431 [Glomus cerebriforme]